MRRGVPHYIRLPRSLWQRGVGAVAPDDCCAVGRTARAVVPPTGPTRFQPSAPLHCAGRQRIGLLIAVESVWTADPPQDIPFGVSAPQKTGEKMAAVDERMTWDISTQSLGIALSVYSGDEHHSRKTCR